MTQIGTSELNVYPLCLGTNTFGWTSTPQESHAVLDDYVAAGGNFLDTADSYSNWADGNNGGESEQIIGDWLHERGRRDQVVVATKVGKLAPNNSLRAQAIRQGAEDSLRRLKTDYIDLYYAHAQDLYTPTEESVQAFDSLVREGKVRYVGLSNFEPDRLRQWMELAPQESAPVALQPHYNLLHRSDFEQTLLPVAKDYNLAVVPYFALAAGALTGKYLGKSVEGERAPHVAQYMTGQAQEVIAIVVEIADEHNVEPASIAIAWLLAQEAVAAPIASARVRSQLPSLLEGATVTLGDDELRRLDLASKGL